VHLVTAELIRRFDVEGVLRRSHQRRRIGAIGKAVDARLVVRIIGHQAQAAESAGQIGELLLQPEFQPPDVGVVAVGIS
jgi:hypothetical protein